MKLKHLANAISEKLSDETCNKKTVKRTLGENDKFAIEGKRVKYVG